MCFLYNTYYIYLLFYNKFSLSLSLSLSEAPWEAQGPLGHQDLKHFTAQTCGNEKHKIPQYVTETECKCFHPWIP